MKPTMQSMNTFVQEINQSQSYKMEYTAVILMGQDPVESR